MDKKRKLYFTRKKNKFLGQLEILLNEWNDQNDNYPLVMNDILQIQYPSNSLYNSNSITNLFQRTNDEILLLKQDIDSYLHNLNTDIKTLDVAAENADDQYNPEEIMLLKVTSKPMRHSLQLLNDAINQNTFNE